MPTWPVSLPQSPLLDGLTESLGDGAVRSQPEQGPMQVRRRFTAVEDGLAFSFILTAAQRDTLRGFYRTTLLQGSLAFDFPDPLTGSTESVRFDGPPSFEAMGNGYFRTGLSLRRLP